MGKVQARPACCLARTLSLQRANARARSSRSEYSAAPCHTDAKAIISSHELSKRFDAVFSNNMQSLNGVDSGRSYTTCSTSTITTISTTSHSPNYTSKQALPAATASGGASDDKSAAIKRSLSADISGCSSYIACFSALSDRMDRGVDLWDHEFSSMSSYASDLDGMFNMPGIQRKVLPKQGREEDLSRKSWSSSGEEDTITLEESRAAEQLIEAAASADVDDQRSKSGRHSCVHGDISMGLLSNSSSYGGFERGSGAVLPHNSVAVEKVSVNLVQDFRESMYEMMMEKDLEADLQEGENMEDLLNCYLLLNPAELHDVIREVFSRVLIDIIMALR